MSQDDRPYEELLSAIASMDSDPVAVRELAAAGFASSLIGALESALVRSGLRPSDLAKQLGISESAVSQVLNGDGNLRAYTFARYLRALGYVADLRIANANAAAPVKSRVRGHDRLIADVEKVLRSSPKSPVKHGNSFFGLASDPDATASETIRSMQLTKAAMA